MQILIKTAVGARLLAMYHSYSHRPPTSVSLFTTSANADRFAKYPQSVLRAAQPRTQPRTRTYAVYPPLRLTALAKF